MKKQKAFKNENVDKIKDLLGFTTPQYLLQKKIQRIFTVPVEFDPIVLNDCDKIVSNTQKGMTSFSISITDTGTIRLSTVLNNVDEFLNLDDSILRKEIVSCLPHLESKRSHLSRKQIKYIRTCLKSSYGKDTEK